MNDSPQTISFGELRRILRRRRWVVLPLVVIGAVAGVLLALASSREHTATSTVLVGAGTAGGPAGGASNPLSADVAARLVRTRSIAQRVGRQVGDPRPVAELLGTVSVQADDTRAFIDITARDDDSARQAATVANAFAEQFIAARGETARARTQPAIEALERQLDGLRGDSRERASLRSELAELRAAAALGAFDAELIDRAVPGTARASASPAVYGAAGVALGLLLGLVLAFSAEALDPRVRRLEELRHLVDAPQLAALPPSGRRSRRGRQPLALQGSREPLEHLRSALLVLSGQDRLRRIVVTSASDRSEGSAAVAAQLAVSLARLGLRVCVVDCDLRHPGLSSQFGLDDAAPGLADAIRGTAIEQAVQPFAVRPQESSNGSRPPQPLQVGVVTAGNGGPEAPAELLTGERVERVLDELDREHDVVIVQCAPILAAGDALPLVAQASGTVLVVRHSQTPRRDIARAAEVIGDAGGSMLGVVATGVPKGELAADGYGPRSSSAGPRAARAS